MHEIRYDGVMSKTPTMMERFNLSELNRIHPGQVMWTSDGDPWLELAQDSIPSDRVWIWAANMVENPDKDNHLSANSSTTPRYR